MKSALNWWNKLDPSADWVRVKIFQKNFKLYVQKEILTYLLNF